MSLNRHEEPKTVEEIADTLEKFESTVREVQIIDEIPRKEVLDIVRLCELQAQAATLKATLIRSYERLYVRTRKSSKPERSKGCT